MMKMSFSKINTFEQCPLKFQYQYVNRYPTSKSPALLLGQTVHESLNLFFNYNRDRRTVKLLQKIFREEWKKERNKLRKSGELEIDKKTEAEYGRRGLVMLENFYKSSMNADPDQREEFAEAELKPPAGKGQESIPFLGRVDRFDKVVVNGTEGFRVVDYKTGKFNERYLDFIQLFSYAWLMSTQGFKVLSAAYYYLEPDRIVEKRVSEEVFVKTQKNLLERSLPVYKALETGEFAPTPSKLCPWCDFQKLCPAMEGKPD